MNIMIINSYSAMADLLALAIANAQKSSCHFIAKLQVIEEIQSIIH